MPRDTFRLNRDVRDIRDIKKRLFSKKIPIDSHSKLKARIIKN